jgi:prepilin peptidase CpaA
MTDVTAIPLAIIDCACVAAGYCDVRYRSIPQWLACVTTLAGIALQVLRFGPHGFFNGLGAGAAAFLVSGLLYAAGLAGGGDVKLFTAISCGAGLGQLAAFARATGLLGGLLALLYAAAGATGISGKIRGLPYGVAVAAAGIMTLKLWP